MRRIALTIVLGMVVMPAVAQTPARQKPAFEVASIKPNVSGAGSVALDADKGRFLASNMTLRTLLRYAFDRQLPEDGRGRGSVLFSGSAGIQVVGGPGWITSDRFDVEGKPQAGHLIKQPEMQLMVQSLLENRFQLKAHYESREVPEYHLIVAKEGRIKRSEDQSSGPTDEKRTIGGIQLRRGSSGLEGVFNLTLQWTPDGTRPPGPDNGAAIEAPSIFTAIQEQLGFRLRAQKVPIEVLVIDHAEKPSKN